MFTVLVNIVNRDVRDSVAVVLTVLTTDRFQALCKFMPGDRFEWFGGMRLSF